MLFPVLCALLGGLLVVAGLVYSCLRFQCKPKTEKRFTKAILPPFSRLYCVQYDQLVANLSICP